MNRAEYIQRIRRLARSVDLLAELALESLDYTPTQREKIRRAVAQTALYAAEAEAAPAQPVAQALGELSVSAAARVSKMAEVGLLRAERQDGG